MEIPQPWMARGPLFRQPAVEEIAKDWLWDGGLNMGYHQNRTFKKDTPLDLGASYAQTRKNKKTFPRMKLWNTWNFMSPPTNQHVWKVLSNCNVQALTFARRQRGIVPWIDGHLQNHRQLPHSRCPRSPKWGEKSFVSGRCFIWRGWDSPCSITTLSDSKPSWQFQTILANQMPIARVIYIYIHNIKTIFIVW